MLCEDEPPRSGTCRGSLVRRGMARHVKDVKPEPAAPLRQPPNRGRVSPEGHDQQPEDDRSHDRLPANGDEDVEAGGDAFAALKSQPDGERRGRPRPRGRRASSSGYSCRSEGRRAKRRNSLWQRRGPGWCAGHWARVASFVAGADISAATVRISASPNAFTISSRRESSPDVRATTGISVVMFTAKGKVERSEHCGGNDDFPLLCAWAVEPPTNGNDTTQLCEPDH